jgi:uncharacterized membrane protein
MEVIGGFFGLLIVAVVVVAIFFICRSLFLWYWKLDKIEEHLSAIRVEIEKKNDYEMTKDRQQQNSAPRLGKDVYEKKS